MTFSAEAKAIACVRKAFDRLELLVVSQAAWRKHDPVLTSADYCDPLSKTPYHKNVPVRIRRRSG